MPTTIAPIEPRTGTDLIDAAAGGQSLTVGEATDLLEYYLTNKALPGSDAHKDLEVELGDGEQARKFGCTIRTIEWSEWQDAIERATDKATGDYDRFVSSSWVVARALTRPALGPAISRLHEEAKRSSDGKIDGPDGRVAPPTDAAMLLRRMFATQSGSLLELSVEVLKISRLAGDTQSVREVAAAKN